MRQLLTTYYEENNPIRKQELDFCLMKNATSGLFKRIFILRDSEVPVPMEVLSQRITQIIGFNKNRRPTYADMFSTINGESITDNTLSVVANTDIYFDDTLLLAGAVDLANTCFALSRWDIKQDGSDLAHHDLWDSQDAWIFQGPVKAAVSANFGLGIPGCDNRIAHELQLAGYDVCNPSKTIKAYHIHTSGHRNYKLGTEAYKEFIPRPYYFVYSTYLRIGENGAN